MTPDDTQRVVALIEKWQDSEGNERTNYQTFFGDLCVALNVDGLLSKGSLVSVTQTKPSNIIENLDRLK
jgi:hypothetical protein